MQSRVPILTTIPDSGIYCIQNHVTGKCYIGKSKQLANRIQIHSKYENRSNRHLQEDIKKYGIGLFSYSILEASFPDQLTFLEQKWIEEYQSRGIDLYNKTRSTEVIHTINMNTRAWRRLKKLRLSIAKKDPEGDIMTMGETVEYLLDCLGVER